MRTLKAAALLISLSAAPALAQQQHLTLQDAIALAQRRSPQFQQARAQVEESRALDRAFNARLLPQFALSGTLPAYNRSIISVLQPDGSTQFLPQQQMSTQLGFQFNQRLPVTGGNLTVSSSLSRLQISGSQSVQSWSSQPVWLSLSQDILRPNEAAWDRRMQNAQIVSDERNYRWNLENVAFRTTDLFFNAYAADAGLRNALNNAAVNDTLYKINTGRFAVGRIGENDLLQSQLALLRAQSALEAARINQAQQHELFRLGVGLPADADFDLAVTSTVPSYEPDTARAVHEALLSGTAASSLELQDVQARRRVVEAKLSNGIGATVTASYGFNATAPEARLAYQNLLEGRQLTLGVQVPLWQWGAHSESVRAAQMAQQITNVQAASTRDQVALQAHFAVLQLGQARRSLAILVVADSVAGRRYEVAYNRYVTGRITIDNLYIAQAEKDQALTDYAEGLRHFWESHYNLRMLTLFDFETSQPLR